MSLINVRNISIATLIATVLAPVIVAVVSNGSFFGTSEDGNKSIVTQERLCKVLKGENTSKADVGTLHRYIDSGNDLNEKFDCNIGDKYGKLVLVKELTAIIVASRYGQLEIVESLIKSGADVNARDMHGRTALQWASMIGHPAVVKALINNNQALLDIVNKPFGYSALMEAAEHGCLECVRALIAKGADVCRKNTQGNRTARELAKDAEIVRLLEEAEKRKEGGRCP